MASTSGKRTRAMIDVAAGIVLGSRGHEQDADRRAATTETSSVSCIRAAVGERALGLRALKKITRRRRGAVPTGSPSRSVAASRTACRVGRQEHRLPSPNRRERRSDDPRGPLIFDQRVHQRSRVGCHGQRRFVQKLSPLDEVLFDLARAIPKILAGPDGEFFQIPTQLLRLRWVRSARRNANGCAL